MTDVRPATLDDVDRLAHIAAAAFYDDPVLSWVFPDDGNRIERLRFLMGGLVRDMLPDGGTVHIASGVCAAFWRDPSFEHGRSTADRVSEEADPRGPSPLAADELERLGILGAAMMANHPHEPHWYLNVVGTIPEHQGRGLGTAVMQPVLDRCDADGARAYLESSNPRNVTLYRRNGFVDAGEIPLPDGPSLLMMWRDPH